mmetsp:Transcript_27146/g.38904  ORF Transcript_27146/g.38904 Transcript_27146/m.38904 type:complete len:80 (-) Transcript_27146:924-1163(-)
MRHMGRSNVMMKEIKNAIRPVDGGQGSFDPRPLIVAILWNTGVSMLQPGVENQPGIDPHIGKPVPQPNLQCSKAGTGKH